MMRGHFGRFLMGLAVAVALPLAAADARAESLDAALAKTYLGNPTLNAARAGQRATDEQVPQALSGWRPTVTVTGTIGHDWTDTTSYKIDDDGKTEKSLVRISESNGVLVGNIEKIFDPKHLESKCDLCKDDRKDKPVVGLQIIRGVKQDADDKALWTGGEILDPNNGKTYRTRLKPIEGGKKLEMRGYVGFFYRTQVWVRVE